MTLSRKMWMTQTVYPALWIILAYLSMTLRAFHRAVIVSDETPSRLAFEHEDFLVR